VTWAGAAVPARGISPKGPPRTTPTGTRARPFDVRRSGGTERCATHASLSVLTTTGSRIADVARRTHIRRTIHTEQSPLVSVIVARRNGVHSPRPRRRPPTRYNIVFFLPFAIVLDLASPVDPVAAAVSTLSGTREPANPSRHARSASSRRKTFPRNGRYCKSVIVALPATAFLRIVPTGAHTPLRRGGKTIHQKLNRF